MTAAKTKRRTDTTYVHEPPVKSAETLEVAGVALWAERWRDHVFLWARIRATGHAPHCTGSFRVRYWPASMAEQIDLVQDVGGGSVALFLGKSDAMHLLRVCAAWTGCARELIPEIQTTRVRTSGAGDAEDMAALFGQAQPGKAREGFRAYTHVPLDAARSPRTNPPILMQNPINLVLIVYAVEELGGKPSRMRREIVLPYLPRVQDQLLIAPGETWRYVDSVCWSAEGFTVFLTSAARDHVRALEAQGWTRDKEAASEISAAKVS